MAGEAAALLLKGRIPTSLLLAALLLLRRACCRCPSVINQDTSISTTSRCCSFNRQ